MAATDATANAARQAALQTLAASPSDIIFGWAGLDVSAAPNGARAPVLADVSGFVKRNGITAVVGASSSGKSVLLKTLSGRAKELGALEVRVRRATVQGRPVDLVKEHSARLPMVYVPQGDDRLIGVLTARESLMFAAKLKQPYHADHEALVERTLQRIGLQDSADTPIGTFYRRGLSGGQKRRCTVGLELVSDPTILCLDEPTSGLDTPRAVSVVGALRELLSTSQSDMGIILSIHQPNAELLSYFDHLLILAEGGTAFFGTASQAEVYFSQLGYPVPKGEVLTDHALLMADVQARRLTGYAPSAEALDLVSRFANSHLAAATVAAIESSSHRQYGANSTRPEAPSPQRRRTTLCANAKSPWQSAHKGTFSFADYMQLVNRFLVIARRDLTLFYLQAVLQGVYGFLMGATFYDLPAVINQDVNQIFSSCLWLIGGSCLSFFLASHVLSPW
jgi:ABC-type multidrug transport system ATPase subunit